MFNLISSESKLEKSEAALKQITAQILALEADINEFLKVLEPLPAQNNSVSHSSLSSHAKNETLHNLKLLKQLLDTQNEKVYQSSGNNASYVKKKLAERNVPPNWLFVR